MSMKRFLFFLALMACVGITGCELIDDEEDRDLTFVNQARRSVQVIPLTIEWKGFTLKPGEKKKLYDVRDVDYRLRPDSWFKLGSASTERYIIIVDAPPEKK
jgi:hypothetical protein